MPRRRVVFDNFGGGEYGLLGETHAPPNSFTGANVVRLLDGSLAPRSGLVDLAATGVPTGIVSGFGYNAPQGVVWFTSGTHAYQVAVSATGQAVATLTGSISLPTKRVHSLAQYGTSTFITVYGGATYRLDHALASVTDLTSQGGAPTGRCIAVYGSRLVIGGNATYPNRLYWSPPVTYVANGRPWPTGDFVDIGSSDYAITTITSHFGHLIIGKTDGSWWELRGTLGESAGWSEYWRNKRVGSADLAMRRWSTDVGGALWYAEEDLASPVTFTYANSRSRRYEMFQGSEHLSLNNYGGTITDTGLIPPIGCGALRDPGDIFFTTGTSGTAYDDQGLLSQRGMWSKHTFDVGTSGLVDGRDDLKNRVYICDGGGASTAAKFYALSYDLNRVPISGNSFESLGDASSSNPVDAGFTLPVLFGKDGNELGVSSAVVNFTKWDHGYNVSSAFTVTVTPKQAYGAGDLAAMTGVAAMGGTQWAEAASEASATGTADQETFTFPATFANGFTVGVSNIVGVAIKRIIVTYDERSMQGTA